MSRNLASTRCDHCGSDRVKITGRRHPITQDESGIYFDEFKGLIVADAECDVCRAKYIAWVDDTNCEVSHQTNRGGLPTQKGFFDLSYRSSFDDEPGSADLVYDVEWVPKLTLRHK